MTDNKLMQAWKETRDMTYDLLETLNDTQLRVVQSRPGLNTIGMHLLEMADVTYAYSQSLRSGELNFDEVQDMYSSEDQRKAHIKERLRKSDEALSKAIEHIKPGFSINAFGEETSAEELLLTLLRHENLHHGQIIAFAYASGMELPESWQQNWALPPLKD